MRFPRSLTASLLAGALGLAACGGGAANAPAPGGARQAGAFPAGPPLVTPGERIAFQVKLQNVAIATYDIAVGDVEVLGGKRAIVVQGHTAVSGLAAMVANVDDRFTSWLDVTNGRTLRFTVDELESRHSTNIEHVVVDFAARTPTAVGVEFHLNDEPARPEIQALSLPEVWDYNAFLIALRAWEQPVGTTTTVDVFRSRWMWRIAVTIAEREVLATELGELPALRFDMRARKLDRRGQPAPGDEREFSIWVSDDDGRVPLRVVAHSDYGDVEMNIVAYEPGSGTRLR